MLRAEGTLLAYEIHVSGPSPDDDTARIRDHLARAADAPIDPPYRLSDNVRSLLLPPGVEWTFTRLRDVVAELRSAARVCAVTLVGIPDDDQELLAMLLRQAKILEEHGHPARAKALIREARAYAEHTDELDTWQRAEDDLAQKA